MTSSMPTTTTTTATEVPRPGGAGTLAGATVSRVGYGAMQLQRLHGDRAAAVALVRRAVEAGVDHVDTAHFYAGGFVSDVLAQALRPQDRVTVVSKVGLESNPAGPAPIRPAQRPEQLRATVEENLRALSLEQVPVVNLRRLDFSPGLIAQGDQVVDVEDQLEVMVAMRDEGMIGAIGVSNVTLDVLRAALPAGIVCVQNAYSVVARDDEEMLTLCAQHDIAWVPYCPLGGEMFPGLPKVADEPAVQQAAQSLGATTAQVGLAWLLAHDPRVLLIPGTADANHLAANLAAGALKIDDATMTTLDAISSPLA